MRWFPLALRYTESPEKDKRKSLPVRESWMHTRDYAAWFATLFFVCGLVGFFDRPADNFSVYYLLALGIAGLILGFSVAALFVLLHSFVFTMSIAPYSLYLLPTTGERVIQAALLLAMTLVLFVLIRQLQRFRWLFKRAVYLNYVIPVLLFINYFWAMLSDGKDPVQQFETSKITCDYFLSDTIGIRAVSTWYNPRDYNYEMSTFSVTRDSGHTWREFMLVTTLRRESCEDARLRNFDALNDRFFWFWQGQYAVFTRDGGETWAYWDIDQASAWGVHCSFEYVRFVDERNGKADCSYIEAYAILTTEDGGVTWHEATP